MGFCSESFVFISNNLEEFMRLEFCFGFPFSVRKRDFQVRTEAGSQKGLPCAAEVAPGRPGFPRVTVLCAWSVQAMSSGGCCSASHGPLTPLRCWTVPTATTWAHGLDSSRMKERKKRPSGTLPLVRGQQVTAVTTLATLPCLFSLPQSLGHSVSRCGFCAAVCSGPEWEGLCWRGALTASSLPLS